MRNEYGADYFRFSTVMSDILNRLAIERSRQNLIKLSEAVRQVFGENAFSFAIEKDAIQSPKDIVIVDGIRRMEDISALEALPNFKMIAIDVPTRIRYERIINRGEKAHEKDMTWEQFLEEEKASTEISIPPVMARAWRTIPNDGTPEIFAEKIRELMKELGFFQIH